MKNIAILVPTLNKGGAERVAANLSLEFSKYYNVYVIVNDGSNITYPYRGELIDLKLPPSKGIIGKILTMLKRIKRVRNVKKKYNIDYSISHTPASNYINIFSRQNDKIFTYVHNMIVPSLKNKIREKIYARLSDKMICVSKCVENNMIVNFGIKSEKLLTVYNFCGKIDLCDIKKNDSKKYIVNMGRLSNPKGHWHLIRAFKKVVEVNPNIQLKIIGDGELKEELINLINKLELQQNVELTGFIKNPFKELQKCDIYVSSSLTEGLPMALVEAGMCKLPIISTDCDAGCREILAPYTNILKKTSTIEYAQYGILIPVCKSGDINQLSLTKEEEIMADSILEMINNNEERIEYSKMSYQRAKDFLPENIIEEWKKLLK